MPLIRREGSRIYQAPGRLMVAVTALSLVCIFGTSALAAGHSRVLFSNSLKKASNAMPTGTDSSGSASFRNGHYVVESASSDTTAVTSPRFDATADELASVSIAVDVLPGKNSAAGLACRYHSDSGDRYELLVFDFGAWSLSKARQGYARDELAKSVVARQSGLTVKKPNRVELQCAGPTETGTDDVVKLTVIINGKRRATFNDHFLKPGEARRISNSVPISAGPVALFTTGTATYNNLKVTQL